VKESVKEAFKETPKENIAIALKDSGENEEALATDLDAVSDRETQNADTEEQSVAGELTNKEPSSDTEGYTLSGATDPKIVARLEKVKILISLDLLESAKWELFEIERRTVNKDYLKALILEYEKVGYFHRSANIAGNNFAAQRIAGGIEGQKFLWEKAYPKAYASFVQDYSQHFGVPVEMIWGIMRAESNYRRDAISPVGAMGLMQVMPFTGQKMAELNQDKDFLPSRLLEPAVAIKMGTLYLKRVLKIFSGNRALAAASYNAGPHRVMSWLGRFGNLELDEFIEHIPFVETRNYVKRVLSNYQVYSDLYSPVKEKFPELVQSMNIKVKDPLPTRETWEAL
jgi:soluble lytic murein transglycosylase